MKNAGQVPKKPQKECAWCGKPSRRYSKVRKVGLLCPSCFDTYKEENFS